LNKNLWIFCGLIGALISGDVHAECQDIEDEILSDSLCTKIRTYKSKDASERPTLLVALHGDSPWGPADYQYNFAKEISEKSNNLIAVGMLRPGYSDSMKRTSDGIRGKTVGDNYDETRIHQIAGAILQLKKYYHARKVVLAGHSGGAAITASLIALYPKLIDHAVIVSCPCNINEWRKDMYASSKYDGFKGDLESVSPIDLVKHIASGTEITMFVGNKDDVTKPNLNEEYKTALQQAGKKVTLNIIDGTHDIFMDSQVIGKLVTIVKSYNQ